MHAMCATGHYIPGSIFPDACSDLILAHEAALRLKKVLHRDISSGNVLIYKVPGGNGEIEGLLIDWDLCVNLANVRAARRKGRTGTWEFMSARMLTDPKGCVHEVLDDLESVVYLLYHHTLRYRHTVRISQKASLCHALRNIFNRVEKTSAGTAGGHHKMLMMNGRVEQVENALEAVEPEELRTLLNGVRIPFRDIYATAPRLIPSIPLTRGQVERYEESVAAAKQSCTHDFMLEQFRDALADENFWLDDGPAQDQYPIGVRETLDKGKPIDDHYEVLETGAISVHNRTSMRTSARTSTKRKAENTPIYYAPGSGHISASSGAESDDLDDRGNKRLRMDVPLEEPVSSASEAGSE